MEIKKNKCILMQIFSIQKTMLLYFHGENIHLNAAMYSVGIIDVETDVEPFFMFRKIHLHTVVSLCY